MIFVASVIAIACNQPSQSDIDPTIQSVSNDSKNVDPNQWKPGKYVTTKKPNSDRHITADQQNNKNKFKSTDRNKEYLLRRKMFFDTEGRDIRIAIEDLEVRQREWRGRVEELETILAAEGRHPDSDTTYRDWKAKIVQLNADQNTLEEHATEAFLAYQKSKLSPASHTEEEYQHSLQKGLGEAKRLNMQYQPSLPKPRKPKSPTPIPVALKPTRAMDPCLEGTRSANAVHHLAIPGSGPLTYSDNRADADQSLYSNTKTERFREKQNRQIHVPHASRSQEITVPIESWAQSVWVPHASRSQETTVATEVSPDNQPPEKIKNAPRFSTKPEIEDTEWFLLNPTP